MGQDRVLTDKAALYCKKPSRSKFPEGRKTPLPLSLLYPGQNRQRSTLILLKTNVWSYSPQQQPNQHCPWSKTKAKSHIHLLNLPLKQKGPCASTSALLTGKHKGLWRQRQIPRRERHRQEPKAKLCKPAGCELGRERTQQKIISSK